MPPRHRAPRSRLDERVAAARARLVGANTRAATWLAISGADRETLRVLEAEYYHQPGPIATILDRIVEGHLIAVARLGGGVTSTEAVTPEIVAAWAMDTLTDCLPGMTDFHMQRGGQFNIALTGPEEGQTCSALVFTVTTLLSLDPRRFRVSVSVTEAD